MSISDMDKIDWTLLPDHLHEGVRAYIERGRPTGGFLAAVITGDRHGAAVRADGINRPRLDDIFSFFQEQAPHECQGTPGKMASWIERGGLKGKE